MVACWSVAVCTLMGAHLQPFSWCAEQGLDQCGLTKATVTNNQHLHRYTAQHHIHACEQALLQNKVHATI